MQPIKSDAHIVSKELDVKARLHEFGLKPSDIGKVCESALYGSSLKSGLQPKTAEGLLKYIFGVEGLRQVFLSLNSETAKYEIFSKNNIEGVFDPDNGRKIMFQMSDQACGFQDLQPKSKIGNGKKDFIERSVPSPIF